MVKNVRYLYNLLKTLIISITEVLDWQEREFSKNWI